MLFLMFLSRSGGIIVGLVYCSILALQLYMKLATIDSETDVQMNVEEFGSLMLLIAEMLLCLGIMFVNLNCSMNLDDFIFLMNQMMKYNQVVLEMINSKNIQLDNSHRKGMLLMDMLICEMFLASITLSFGLALALFHPMEPTHRIFEEWLEIEVGFHGIFIPFYFAAVAIFYNCGSIVVILCWNVGCYVMISSTCLNDLQPQRRIGDENGKQRRCEVLTKFYGAMQDDELVTIYRIHRLFNNLMNDFYATVLVSFHPVALLATVSVMIYFAIKFQEIIWQGGFLVMTVVLGIILFPMVLIRFECILCGRLVDASNGLKSEARKIVRRTTFLAKFAKSCDTFYVQVAYPFYTVHRETFLLFCSQVCDYSITLLLW